MTIEVNGHYVRAWVMGPSIAQDVLEIQDGYGVVAGDQPSGQSVRFAFSNRPVARNALLEATIVRNDNRVLIDREPTEYRERN